MDEKTLTAAQQKHLQQLVVALGQAQAAQQAAQANANAFLVYCAEEHGTNGSEWTFDQARMCFVKKEQ